MTNLFDIPSSEDLAKIAKTYQITNKEFGEAIGYGDAERTLRAMMKGERHGRPYAMSATATHALRYMLALHILAMAVYAFQIDDNPGNEDRLASALENAWKYLPARLKPRSVNGVGPEPDATAIEGV